MALPNESKCIVGGTGRDSGERRERTRRAESWLGEPTKQNGDESRARLGATALFAFAGHNTGAISRNIGSYYGTGVDPVPALTADAGSVSAANSQQGDTAADLPGPDERRHHSLQ
jgi:hypothetical protein